MRDPKGALGQQDAMLTHTAELVKRYPKNGAGEAFGPGAQRELATILARVKERLNQL
jgi:hypothetical protein